MRHESITILAALALAALTASGSGCAAGDQSAVGSEQGLGASRGQHADRDADVDEAADEAARGDRDDDVDERADEANADADGGFDRGDHECRDGRGTFAFGSESQGDSNERGGSGAHDGWQR